MGTFVTTVHIVTCFLIIVVVLMQSGKGADISATLGGSSNTVFGSSGGANFFTKATFVLAAIFAVTSLGLTVMGGREKRSVFDGAPAATTSLPQDGTAPAAAAPVSPEAAKKADSKARTERAEDSAKKQVQ